MIMMFTKEFQSLVGTLKTEHLKKLYKQQPPFQSLVGTLKTVDFVWSGIETVEVSIPCRYAKNIFKGYSRTRSN